MIEEKSVKNVEKSSSPSSSGSSSGSGGEYAELSGLLVGKAENAFDGPVTVTIQLLGESSGDLVLTYPNQEAAVKIPNLLDDKGQHVPPIPVMIKIMAGEGAPPPGTAKPKDKEQPKEATHQPPPAGGSGSTY